MKLLFAQVKANFTIDESLKSLAVTAHLTQVPFRVALETLLKSTNTPLSYKVENGIYSVVPKVEEAEQPPAPVNTHEAEPIRNGGYKLGILRPSSVRAQDIVTAFGGIVLNIGYTPQQNTGYGSGGLGGGIGGGLGSGLVWIVTRGQDNRSKKYTHNTKRWCFAMRIIYWETGKTRTTSSKRRF